MSESAASTSLTLIACSHCGAACSADLRTCWLCNAALAIPASNAAGSTVASTQIDSPFAAKVAEYLPLEKSPAGQPSHTAIDRTMDISLWVLAAVLLVIVLTVYPNDRFVALVVAATAVPAYGIMLMTSMTSRLSGRPMKSWVKLVTLLTSAAVIAPLAAALIAVLFVVSFIIAVFQACFPNA